MKDEKGLTLPNLKEITENTLKEFMEKYAQEKMIDRYCDDVIELAKQEEEFAIKFRDYMKHHDEEEIQAHKEFDEDDLEFFGRCWKNEIELFSQDIDLTIRFLDHECTAEEFVFIKDIFNEDFTKEFFDIKTVSGNTNDINRSSKIVYFYNNRQIKFLDALTIYFDEGVTLDKNGKMTPFIRNNKYKNQFQYARCNYVNYSGSAFNIELSEVEFRFENMNSFEIKR